MTKGKLSTAIASILVVLTLLSIIAVGYSIFYWLKKDTVKVNTAYVNALTYAEDVNGDAVYPMQVKYYSNTNKNGLKSFEFINNYYTDSDTPNNTDISKNYYSSGVQIIDYSGRCGNFVENRAWYGWGDDNLYWTLKSPYYYNRDVSGTSYAAVKSLIDMDKWITDCNGTLVCMDLIGKVTTKTWKKGIFFNYKETTDYNYSRFVYDLENACASLKDGKHILQFDLSKYFTFRLQDPETKKFTNKVTNKEDLNFVIVNILIEKSSNGLISSKQSLFGNVKNNPDYSQVKEDSNYFDYSHTYYLNEYDFDILSDPNGTEYMHLIKLKEDVYSFISGFLDLDIVININLNSNYFVENYCSGFANDAFRGIDFKFCKISSSNTVYFAINQNNGSFVFENVLLKEGA